MARPNLEAAGVHSENFALRSAQARRAERSVLDLTRTHGRGLLEAETVSRLNVGEAPRRPGLLDERVRGSF